MGGVGVDTRRYHGIEASVVEVEGCSNGGESALRCVTGADSDSCASERCGASCLASVV